MAVGPTDAAINWEAWAIDRLLTLLRVELRPHVDQIGVSREAGGMLAAGARFPRRDHGGKTVWPRRVDHRLGRAAHRLNGCGGNEGPRDFGVTRTG